MGLSLLEGEAPAGKGRRRRRAARFAGFAGGSRLPGGGKGGGGRRRGAGPWGGRGGPARPGAVNALAWRAGSGFGEKGKGRTILYPAGACPLLPASRGPRSRAWAGGWVCVDHGATQNGTCWLGERPGGGGRQRKAGVPGRGDHEDVCTSVFLLVYPVPISSREPCSPPPSFPPFLLPSPFPGGADRQSLPIVSPGASVRNWRRSWRRLLALTSGGWRRKLPGGSRERLCGETGLPGPAARLRRWGPGCWASPHPVASAPSPCLLGGCSLAGCSGLEMVEDTPTPGASRSHIVDVCTFPAT